MDIEKIREVCTLRKIKWSVHVAARMAERDIKRSDVINCMGRLLNIILMIILILAV